MTSVSDCEEKMAPSSSRSSRSCSALMRLPLWATAIELWRASAVSGWMFFGSEPPAVV
jgi:hypothetical protein